MKKENQLSNCDSFTDEETLQKASSFNKPISYDYHGKIPINVPFKEIKPNDITLYFHIDTRVGKHTCQQTCSHCFFISEKDSRAKYIEPKKALEITQSLKNKGYSVYPRTSDSLTNNGEYLRIFTNSNVRNYCYGDNRSSTEVMEQGEIWTSGAQLLEDNWQQLLKLGLKNNFATISITFHGVLDNELNLKPEDSYPFRRVFYGQKAEKVVSRIKQFNREQAASHNYSVERLQHCKIAFGVTIGRHNNLKQDLINYVKYFNKIGVAKVRFNCFHDYSKKHKQLELSTKEIEQFYKDIKWIHTNIQMDYELGLSEDFGDKGIEIMEFPQTVGICQAGRQLFAIVPEKPELIEKKNNMEIEKIGSVAGCVDAFKPIMGQLIASTNIDDSSVDYNVDFFHDVIDEVSQKRLKNHYKNGCFGPELHKELIRDDILTYNIGSKKSQLQFVKQD